MCIIGLNASPTIVVISLIEALVDQRLDREELEYALRKARGIIIGYAMEYRALKILENQGFEKIRLATAPTHDIEAVKNDRKYYIEVKASRYNPTKHYTAWKIAMITLLDGEHYTLIIRPSSNPILKPTIEILSPPKKILYYILKAIKDGNLAELRKIVEKQENKKILKQYTRTIKWFTERLIEQQKTRNKTRTTTQ